ncbi:MAG TPA: ATP-binding cassette domain-containing protein [Longimicrobium sp.]|nr:ATP-binding cassette domain-containing protein [Longimicrobium sp.]
MTRVKEETGEPETGERPRGAPAAGTREDGGDGGGAPPPLFTLRGVTQERGGTAILRELSLELPRTEIVALVGPSGAGKTSLLRLLNRLDDPAAGAVEFGGQPITSYPVGALRRRVGFVFQSASMFPGTVLDNLRIAADLGGTGAAADAPPVARVLAAVGLADDYAGREAGRLSGGEQQRVSIARALMTRPEVLLMDEPTSALDPEVAERLLATVVRLTREQGLSVVMVTHRLSEARQMSTWTVMLEGGRLVEAGPTARLFGGASTARAREYLASGG